MKYKIFLALIVDLILMAFFLSSCGIMIPITSGPQPTRHNYREQTSASEVDVLERMGPRSRSLQGQVFDIRSTYGTSRGIARLRALQRAAVTAHEKGYTAFTILDQSTSSKSVTAGGPSYRGMDVNNKVGAGGHASDADINNRLV
jgi:hypothetical protein